MTKAIGGHCNCGSEDEKDGTPDVIWYTSPLIQFFATMALPLVPFTISVRAPRLVPADADIWKAIFDADVERVRELFLSGRASVYDVNASGETVLEVSSICDTASH